MNSKGVIVVGSLHYDIFVQSSHLPKAGEIVVGNNWYPKLGGKGGNQAIAASDYGCFTKIISVVGDDTFGKYMLDKINLTDVNTDDIQINNKYNSGMSVALSDSEGEYGAVIVSGANFHIKPEIFKSLKIWENCKILMIQNEIDENTNIAAATNAKLNGLKVCLNASPPKKIISRLIDNIDILIVNTIEAEYLSQEKITSLEEAKNISKKLSDIYKTVIITSGDKGVTACEKNDSPFHIPALNVKVNSTHGAGDVFAGTLCAALAADLNLLEAITLSNEKAGFHIAK